LHGARSAASIARFRDAHPDRPVVLVLTGTDLYRDLPRDPSVRRSLAIADRVVVLQADALAHVPPEFRAKCRVIFQSARPLAARRSRPARLEAIAVGHLRDEKDPRTIWRALARLEPGLDFVFRHVGDALDPALEAGAREAMARDARYRWIGALPHGLARAAIRDASLLVHPSKMEGGANVIVEAVLSGTPVLASRMSGNVGMLGEDYPGLFPVGDDGALAEALTRLARDRSSLATLRAACRRLRSRFAPEAEMRAVRAVVSPQR